MSITVWNTLRHIIIWNALREEMMDGFVFSPRRLALLRAFSADKFLFFGGFFLVFFVDAFWHKIYIGASYISRAQFQLNGVAVRQRTSPHHSPWTLSWRRWWSFLFSRDYPRLFKKKNRWACVLYVQNKCNMFLSSSMSRSPLWMCE